MDLLKEFKKKYSVLKKHVIILISLILLGTFFSCVSPYIFGRLIDIISDKDAEFLLVTIMVYIAVNLLTSVLGQTQNFMRNILLEKMCNSVKTELFQKIVYYTSESRDKYNTGELINRIEGDCNEIINFYIDFITNMMIILFNVFFSVTFLIRLSLINTIIVFANILIVFIINEIFKKKLKAVKMQLNTLADRYNSFVYDAVNNSRHIKNFMLESDTLYNFNGFKANEFNLVKKTSILQGISNLLKNLGFNVCNFFMLLMFALLIRQDRFSIGSMVSFNSYMNRLYGAISQIVSLRMASVSVKLSMERISQICEEECEKVGDSDFKWTNSQYDWSVNSLIISDLTFGYGMQGSRPVLKNFSLQIDERGIYCVVGQNGCGKSTLFKLITRLYSCCRNSIFVNNIDIQDINLCELREKIIYLSNDVYLLNDTIEKNLLMVNKQCDHEDIISACKKTGIHDDIMNYVLNYETKLGADGVSLSNGQMQKLNFARAYLKRGSLILLDEIDSGLDGKAEKKLIQNVENLSKKNIIVMITHCKNFLKHANRIFVVENGTIKESGNHSYLLKNCTEYRKLFGES